MNRDDVIRWATQCKMPYDFVTGEIVQIEKLERFAALVAAAERQRLHEKFMEIHKSQQHSNNYWHFAARKIKEEA